MSQKFIANMYPNFIINSFLFRIMDLMIKLKDFIPKIINTASKLMKVGRRKNCLWIVNDLPLSV